MGTWEDVERGPLRQAARPPSRGQRGQDEWGAGRQGADGLGGLAGALSWTGAA